MKILQLHTDYVEYTPIEREISVAEETATSPRRFEDAVVLLTSAEIGDNQNTSKEASDDITESIQKLGAKRILVYPFAHLAQDLAPPTVALEIIKTLATELSKAGFEVHRAPFGWNKSLELKVKGHPLAEQSKSYPQVGHPKQPYVEASHSQARVTEANILSRLRKADFSGLPETDHRIIGERLDLFSFQEVSPGMVYWHYKGLRLKELLLGFLRAELAKRNYIEVSTPALANTALWRVSGHSEHYKDDMFLTKMGNEEMGLKPMNCPSTFLIYKSRRWSFRELPVRYSIFDPLYRNELSGVSSGLFRVKALTQDDAHIIATEEQVKPEISDMLDHMEKVYKTFDLGYKVKISTRPDNSMGSEEEWKQATDTLIEAVKSKGWTYEIKEKEGNFYAPKIDVDIRDSLGREWQCGTFQLDLQMPKRFGLVYTGSDGKEHTPVVLHRTILGSLERFTGIILEHYKGALPVWLSPVQARVISISDEHIGYARRVLSALDAAGIRVESDFESGTLGAKIRNARLQRVPYMVIVGKKEEEEEQISVRTREGAERRGMSLQELLNEISEKSKLYE